MNQEDKELLLKDLLARLPYHVRCKIWLKDGTTEKGPLDLEHNYGDVLKDAFYYNEIIDIKPYLRPMSSMTEEEQKEFVQFHCVNLCPVIINGMLTLDNESKMFDWLNAHHFDYRGLIERGLAIAVTEENNPYNRKE